MMRSSRILKSNLVSFGTDSTIFADRSVLQLMRTMFIFRVCSIRPLVRHSRKMLDLCEKLIGERLTYDILVRRSVYTQFCAGSNEAELKPSLRRLSEQNVGPILDYAAEAPVDTSEQAKELTASALEVNLRKLLKTTDITYAPDSYLDANISRFLTCMDAAKDNTPASGMAFAAIKITGLCDPQLLARVTAIMLRIRQTWAEYFIPENEGHAPPLEDCRDVLGRSKGKRPRRCDIEDFRAGVQQMQPSIKEDELDAVVKMFDKGNKGYVHYFDYTTIIRRACINHNYNPPELQPFLKKIPRLTKEESEMGFKFDQRIERIVQRASELKVRLMIDAEQSYYQTAIDAIVRDLQRKYNREFPCVYNTFQAYLKFSYKRVSNDLARSRREGWIFAAKIVRGAYMDTERKDAREIGYESPIHETKEYTHAMYDQIGMRIMEEIESGRRVAALFGTHNVQSLKLLTDRIVDIEKRGRPAEEIDVAFAQLYGMGDHLTLPLAKAGHRAFKYVPYGPVKETTFYLQRRAEENQDMLRQSTGEWPLLKNELKRKLFRLK